MENWDYNVENAEELWDVYDCDEQKLSYCRKRSEGLKEGEFHRVIRIWIVNSMGEILLSQRGKGKRGAFLWECTAGSALSGESSEQTICREVKEELGVDLSAEHGIRMEKLRRDAHQDFYEIWLYRLDIPLSQIKIDGVEVVNVQWVTIDRLEDMLSEGRLMPTLKNFPELYRKFIV